MVTLDVCGGLESGHDEERLHEYMWRMHDGSLCDLWSAFRGGNSLASSPGPISCWGVRCTLTLGFGRLRFGLRGASIPYKFTQELELGQEELPDYIPTEEHEEQRTDNCGHNDQQCESDTLPHLSWTLDSTNRIRRWKRCIFCFAPRKNEARLAAWQPSQIPSRDEREKNKQQHISNPHQRVC